jgi:CspA family cold shock protein
MASGTIASLRDRGFGFIMPDGTVGRGDLFFHWSAVAGASFDELREGQRVSFDAEPDPRDPSRQRAVNVSLVGDLTEAEPRQLSPES